MQFAFHPSAASPFHGSYPHHHHHQTPHSLKAQEVTIVESLQSDSSNQNLSTAIRVTWLYSATQLLIANKGTKFHPHCPRPGFLGPCPSRRPDFQSPWASLDLQFLLLSSQKSTQRTGMETSAQGPGVPKFHIYISITHVIHQKQIYNNPADS